MRRFWIACLALWASFSLPATAQEEVGAATLIEVGAYRTPAQQSTPQVLTLRDAVYFNDQVATEPDGALRVTFIDGSVLNVGPSSDVVIDRFVFVPGGDQNGLAVTASEGMFRFASGLMPDERIEIETPTVALGVRGTINAFWVDPARGTLVQALTGTTLLFLGGQTIALPPGTYGYVDPTGQATTGTVTGGIGQVLRSFGFTLPPGQLGTFLRFVGNRSLVPYGEVIERAGFAEDWWLGYCGAWQEDGQGASDEVDGEFAAGCGGGGGQEDGDRPEDSYGDDYNTTYPGPLD